jgi:ferredoxin--NADP+ reductase
MFEILIKKMLAPDICFMEVHAPRIAGSALPGQFLIVRVDEKGERIPLTIADYNRNEGTIIIVTQALGASTKKINGLSQGDKFANVAGPLGKPSELVYIDKTGLSEIHPLFVAGGLGAAPIYPQVKFMYENGYKCDVVLGSRSSELIIFRDELVKVSKHLYIATNDGSEGIKGFVTDSMRHLIENEKYNYNLVVTIGPMIMMKAVADYTRSINLRTIASLNTLMVDGTGMCGACRVTVGGKTMFTCVDGPEFDAHLVDFDEAMRRQGMYKNEEDKKEEENNCKI